MSEWSPEFPANASKTATALSLPRLLHGIGGLVVVAAVSVFLFQGWEDGNDTSRYLLLLGDTLALALAGFASGHWLKEGRGARLLVGLAMASVPVNFAILGGLSYPYLSFDAVQLAVPAYAQWDAGSATAAIGLVLASLMSLGAVLWLGFLVMARRSAATLAGLFLLSNSLLLVPTRDGPMLAWLTLVAAAVLLGASQWLMRGNAALGSREGQFARSVLLLPLLVVVGRSLWLYSSDAWMLVTLAALTHLLLRFALLALRQHPAWRQVIGLFTGVSVLSLGWSLWLALYGSLHGFSLPLIGTLLALLLWDLDRIQSDDPGMHRDAAPWVFSLGMIAGMLDGGWPQALLCLTTGIGVLIAGYRGQHRAGFFAGLTGATAGLGYAVLEAIQQFSLGGWSGLALLGLLVILTGSLLEREKGLAFRLKHQLQTRFHSPTGD